MHTHTLIGLWFLPTESMWTDTKRSSLKEDKQRMLPDQSKHGFLWLECVFWKKCLSFLFVAPLCCPLCICGSGCVYVSLCSGLVAWLFDTAWFTLNIVLTPTVTRITWALSLAMQNSDLQHATSSICCSPSSQDWLLVQMYSSMHYSAAHKNRYIYFILLCAAE